MEKYKTLSNLIEEYKKTDKLLLADISWKKKNRKSFINKYRLFNLNLNLILNLKYVK